MGQLCDAGCIVTFNAETVVAKYNDLIVLDGKRTPETMLWQLSLTPLHPQLMHQANGAIGSATPAELVTFAHALLFSPALSTLHKALDKGYISNFPGLTATLLQKYPPQSIPMVKGHLKQTDRINAAPNPSP
jgi:hypothetical protein